MYIMKIMWRDFKKFPSSRFRDIQKRAKSPNFEWSCSYTGGKKTGLSFQDRKNENTPNFPAPKYDIKQHFDATSE